MTGPTKKTGRAIAEDDDMVRVQCLECKHEVTPRIAWGVCESCGSNKWGAPFKLVQREPGELG